MRIYRLTLSRRAQAGTALSGEGARRVGGRWTPVGRPVVHASASIALAVLETLVHTAVDSIPSHHVIAVDVPGDVAVDVLPAATLPGGWRRTPPPSALQELGRVWLDVSRTAILQVPSAIVPLEFNYLLNPDHGDFKRLLIREPAPFRIDKRLFGQTP